MHRASARFSSSPRPERPLALVLVKESGLPLVESGLSAVPNAECPDGLYLRLVPIRADKRQPLWDRVGEGRACPCDGLGG